MRLQIELYADPTARGGVLEPEGMVEIKFRTNDFVAAMHRLDRQILSLKANKAPGSEAAVKRREKELMPIYRQVSPALTSSTQHDLPLAQILDAQRKGPKAATNSSIREHSPMILHRKSPKEFADLQCLPCEVERGRLIRLR